MLVDRIANCQIVSDRIKGRYTLHYVGVFRAEYGRQEGEELCDGSLGQAPDQDCLTSQYLSQLQTLCHGQQTCDWVVPLNSAVCGRGIKAQAIMK